MIFTMGIPWALPASRGRSGFPLEAFCRVCNSPGSVIPHTLHKLRLRCFNGKKATAAIPNAVQELTSLSILGHEFLGSKKHRYSLEPAASGKAMKRYDENFKIEALKLSDEIGVKKACEQLNVNYGKLYVSPLFDCYNGEIISLVMDTNMKKELCIKTITEAYKNFDIQSGA
ncbi:MAG: hypothetical protein ACTTJ8_07405, partial [Treponema sp.]